MNFATVDNIREISGFVNNTNITDATIERYQTQANSYIYLKVAETYDINDLTDVKLTWSITADFLARVEEIYTSGFLLMKEYGNQQLWEDNEWLDMINEAKALLSALLDNDPPLVDKDGEMFERKKQSIATKWIGSYLRSDSDFSVWDTR